MNRDRREAAARAQLQAPPPPPPPAPAINVDPTVPAAIHQGEAAPPLAAAAAMVSIVPAARDQGEAAPPPPPSAPALGIVSIVPTARDRGEAFLAHPPRTPPVSTGPLLAPSTCYCSTTVRNRDRGEADPTQTQAPPLTSEVSSIAMVSTVPTVDTRLTLGPALSCSGEQRRPILSVLEMLADVNRLPDARGVPLSRDIAAVSGGDSIGCPLGSDDSIRADLARPRALRTKYVQEEDEILTCIEKKLATRSD